MALARIIKEKLDEWADNISENIGEMVDEELHTDAIYDIVRNRILVDEARDYMYKAIKRRF